MIYRPQTVLAAALSTLLALPALAQDTTADTVVASVNGTEITVGHMILVRSQLPAEYQSLPADVLFNGIREQLIQQTALSDTVEELTGRLQMALDNERRSLLAGVALDRALAEAVTDEAIQEAYDAQFANAEPLQEYNASHILVETEAEAQALVAELAAGADFAELAREHSTGPSGPSGGQLGWFGPGRMVPEFETAVVGLEVGGVSAPVQTQFG